METIIKILQKILNYLTGIKDYNNTIAGYTFSQGVYAYCNEIAFINTGTSNVLINNVLLLTPTQSISFDGKKGERDVTVYTITFDNSAINNCIVIRKFYNT